MRRASRRWRRRALIAVLAAANLIVFGSVLGIWYWADRASSEIATIPEHELPSIDPAPGGSSQPRVFLLIGSDSRDNIPDDLPGEFGGGGGQRADVIMLIRLIPGESRAQILSIPRDLKVEIPDREVNKVNAAYAFGGPDLMVQTVKSVTRVPIHHYVEMDFGGFASIVDALGGVRMYFPYPARDAKSGLDVPAGLVEMDGADALAYARSRSYQERRDGSWVSVEADDLGRIKRQQRLVFAILEEAKRPSTVTELGGLMQAMGEHVRSDAGLSSRTMVQLAWDLRALGVEGLEAASLPVDFSFEDGISYVVAREPDASDVLEAFRRGSSLVTAVEGPPRVRILNGNGIRGAAGEAADDLERRGFPVVEVGDADRHDYQTTLVVARPEELWRARDVAEALGFGEVIPGELPDGVEVVVILGTDATSLEA